jgi:hypothetical protein
MMVITVHVANRYGTSRAEHGTITAAISANADRQLQVTRRLARR